VLTDSGIDNGLVFLDESRVGLDWRSHLERKKIACAKWARCEKCNIRVLDTFARRELSSDEEVIIKVDVRRFAGQFAAARVVTALSTRSRQEYSRAIVTGRFESIWNYKFQSCLLVWSCLLLLSGLNDFTANHPPGLRRVTQADPVSITAFSTRCRGRALLVAFTSHRMFPERVRASQCSCSTR